MQEERQLWKVVYYKNVSNTEVDFKWFKTYELATEFTKDKTDRIIEVKSYSIPAHYPDANLDFS
jgi:hypothetical protein